MNTQFNHVQQGLFFVEDTILTSLTHTAFIFPFQKIIDTLALTVQGYHQDGDVTIFTCSLNAAKEMLAGTPYALHKIKKFLPLVTPKHQKQLLRAYHWANWNKQSKYCGQCAEPLIVKFDVTEKKCAKCNLSFFPRFSPAVMVLVQREDKILLARSHHFPSGDYSALAGFVDVGETAEEAAYREVKEEVGITIKNLRYFSTQTWPFPDSFMIAFTADYESGEIKIDNLELEDARWFFKKEVPRLTPSISISRQLIQSVL